MPRVLNSRRIWLSSYMNAEYLKYGFFSKYTLTWASSTCSFLSYNTTISESQKCDLENVTWKLFVIGERPFKCDVDSCGKSFTRNEELTRHKRIHTGVRPHSCVVCGKRFGRKDHLKKHTRTHEMRDPYRVATAALSVFALGHPFQQATAMHIPDLPPYVYQVWFREVLSTTQRNSRRISPLRCLPRGYELAERANVCRGGSSLRLHNDLFLSSRSHLKLLLRENSFYCRG